MIYATYQRSFQKRTAAAECQNVDGGSSPLLGAAAESPLLNTRLPDVKDDKPYLDDTPQQSLAGRPAGRKRKPIYPALLPTRRAKHSGIDSATK
jgi:hypothetical protein